MQLIAVVHTYQNGKSYNHFLLNTEIRLNIIPQKLIWKFGGEYDLFKDEGKKISEFVGGTDLTYIGKHFIGKVEFVSPIRYLAKGVEYKELTFKVKEIENNRIIAVELLVETIENSEEE